jgi:hypothetical protein
MPVEAPSRYFEDYPPGAVFEGGAIPVSEAEILEFARKYDAQAMHTNPAAAASGFFGGLIASGWHTALDDAAFYRVFSIARVESRLAGDRRIALDEARAARRRAEHSRHGG